MATVALLACGNHSSSGFGFDTPSGDAGAITSGGDATVVFGGDATVIAPQALSFDPSSATVVVNGSGPQSVKYALKATDASGNVTMVTADSVEFDRPDLATIAPGEPVVVTAPASAALYGGTGTVHALYDGKEATATLTVQVQLADYGAGLSASSPAVVALNDQSLGADPSVSILYPYDKTVWPLGLTSPLLMCSATQTGDIYRLHYAEKNYMFDGYYTLGALPAQLRLDQGAWDRITSSNDAANGPDPLAFSLSRWDAVASVAYATASQTWTVAPESLRGAIYYWSASETNGVRSGHISRFQPGTGAVPQVLNNGICMGCHAVNAQGTVLVGDIDDQDLGGTHTAPSIAPYDNLTGTRPWASFDITQASTPLTYQSTEFGGDVALTPDGKWLVFGGPASPPGSKYFSLSNLQGAVVATSGLDQVTLGANETNLEQPAFSPDGKKLAIVETSNDYDRDNVIPDAPELIAYLNFDESGPTFDPTLNVVVDGSSPAFASSGDGLGYPSFTPDSLAVAFHAGHRATGCIPNGSCDDTTTDDGDLFISALSGGSPIRLAAADDSPNPADLNSSVEPTFNPDDHGGYSWVVFTSMRSWGNQPWPSDVTATGLVNGKRRLWIAAVDPTLGTGDPSHPAIYLEGQEDTPNMRGFWAQAACVSTPSGGAGADAGGGCTNGFDCCSGFCQNGLCADLAKLACVGVGGTCTTASDCCNSGEVKCTQGICSVSIQ